MAADVGVLILRLLVGGIFLYEGAHKIFSPPDVVRGRDGLRDLIAARGFPRPAALMWLVCISEVVCGTLVAAGLFTRIALIPLALIVGMATFTFKWRAGYANGWDWPFTVLVVTVALVFLGPGNWSLDGVLALPLGASW